MESFELISEPWVEKYRPNVLKDICGQNKIITLFEKMQQQNQTMHFLFYGPPGTGKTSSILAFCKQIYHGQIREQYILEINASYEHGIDMVREKIKTFCKKSITPFYYNNKLINYKFVILDEADTLTIDAQNALRRCIEVYSYNTRFCFMCNYVSHIISPILSRCYVCHFQPVLKESAVKYIINICEKEKIQFDEEIIKTIYDCYMGDLRRCISTIQAIINIYGKLNLITYNNYNYKIPTSYWSKIQNISISLLTDEINKNIKEGKSIRGILSSIIEWACETLSDKQIYNVYLKISKFEKQTLHITDNRTLLFEIFYYIYNIK